MDKHVTSVTKEIVEPKEGTRRYSTGGIIARGSLSPSNSKEKFLPNYLRAPKGSCHDYCKYGRKHDFEAEAEHPFLHKLGENGHHEDPYQVNFSNQEEKSNRLVRKMKSSSQVKPKVTKQKALLRLKESKSMEDPVSLNLQSPSPSHKSSAAGVQVILSISLENEHIQVREMNKGDRNIEQKSKPKASPQAKDFCHKTKFIDQDLSLDNIIKQKSFSPLQKDCPSGKPNVLKKLPTKSKTKPDRHHTFKQRVLVRPKMVDTSAKPAMPQKTSKTPAARLGSPLTTSIDIRGRMNEGYKIKNSRGITKMVEKKMSKPQTPSLSLEPTGDGASSLKPRKCRRGKQPTIMKNQEVGTAKPVKENKEAKTAYATESIVECVSSDGLQQILPSTENDDFISMTQRSCKSENIDLDSLQHECVDLYPLEQKSPKAENLDLNCIQQKSKDDQSSESVSYCEEETEESEFAFTESSEFESENEATKSSSDSKSLRSEERKLRKTLITHPEDNLPSPYKLRFRRGKVIESQPESNGPRRLRFRKGRVVGDSGTTGGEVGRRSFQKALSGDAVLEDPNPEAPTIVLRHQDMQEKKDAQGLFNNVIEETASKLVESRKSKVKALVGAFETVISLQDNKPASTA